MAIHWILNGKQVCNTKQRKNSNVPLQVTENKEEVTCKRCLNVHKKSTIGKVRAEKYKNYVYITFPGSMFKIPLGEFDMFLFATNDGRCSINTSIKFSNSQIKKRMKKQDMVYFKKLFLKLKKENDVLTGKMVYDYIKEGK